MLRLVLNAHSQVGVPKEMPYFVEGTRTGSLEDWRAPGMTGSAYRDFVGAFLERRRIVLEGIDIDRLEEEIVQAGPPDLRRPFQMTIEAWMRREGKARWGEKTPKHLFFVDILHEMFPDAVFVHLVRDPRGAVYSMNRFAQFTEDSVLNAFNWLQAVEVGYALLERAVPAEQRWTIRFEDLVEDPEPTIRALCTFIDEPFEQDMLQFYEQVEQHVNPNFRRLGGVHTLTKPISRRTADKWREGLSERDIALVEEVCGDVMQRFGYDPEGNGLSASERLAVAGKLAYCRWQWWRNRRNRVFLVASKPLARTQHRLGTLVPDALKAKG